MFANYELTGSENHAAGLVRDTWRGRERIWEVEARRLEKARGYLDHVSRQWDAAIGRLKAFVEHEP